MGGEKLNALLQESLSVALKPGALKPSGLTQWSDSNICLPPRHACEQMLES
jgi:hypothetical protein